MHVVKQISEHMVRVFAALQAGEWMTATAVATASGVARRTARAHLSDLFRDGLLERRETFGGYHFRIRAAPGDRAAATKQAIVEAGQILQGS